MRLKALGKPGVIKGLKISRSRNGTSRIRISWSAVAGALAYRITIAVSGSARPVRLVSSKRVLSFTVKSSRVGLTVTVQGQGAMGALGPKATARLAAKGPTRHGHGH